MKEPLKKTGLNLPEGLWRRLRIRALEEGRGVQEVVAELIEKYLSKPLGGKRGGK